MFALSLLIGTIFSIEGHTYGYSTNKIPRYSEDLDRGVVVTVDYAAKKYIAFISWRFLITDDDNIGFNVYREEVSNDDSKIIKLNSEPITKVTYYKDNTIDRTKEYNFFIGSVIGSQEVENSTKYTLKSNTPIIPCYKVPLRKGCRIRTVWPGDLNGDGKFDFVVARNCDLNQKIEGYLSNGTFLWEIDLGHNSLNKNNIRPGPTTINVGHWDGVNVYDLNGDGKAEVFIRIANNVTFGDGYVFLNEGHEEGYKYLDTDQWIACIDGLTGKLRYKSPVPRDFIEHGAMACQMGIGYFDGIKPSLVMSLKNRDVKNNFHQIIATYSFHDSTTFALDWYWTKLPGQSCEDGHHFRVADADLDGKDEFHNIGFILNGDGTLKCDMGDVGISHGDRFYVGRYNKDENQMMGYGVQQMNKDLVTEYYYNADTCKINWKHYSDQIIDNGRGDIGDFDPDTPGLEIFSFYGIYNAKTNTLVHETNLWPANNIFWDGTLSTCIWHRMTINKYDAETQSDKRVYSAYSAYNKVFNEYPHDDASGDYPLFHGDITGDWREEAIVTTRDNDALIIFTTNMDTKYRITSLSQDPGMRSSMSMNGYKQSHMSLMYMATDMDIDKERAFIKEYLRKRAEKSVSCSDDLIRSHCILCEASKCVACDSYKGYFYSNGKCVQQCPDGTLPDSLSGICSNCIDNCGKCSSENTCDKCKDSYYRYQEQCVQNCPAGYQPDEDKNCVVYSYHIKANSTTELIHGDRFTFDQKALINSYKVKMINPNLNRMKVYRTDSSQIILSIQQPEVDVSEQRGDLYIESEADEAIFTINGNEFSNINTEIPISVKKSGTIQLESEKVPLKIMTSPTSTSESKTISLQLNSKSFEMNEITILSQSLKLNVDSNVESLVIHSIDLYNSPSLEINTKTTINNIILSKNCQSKMLVNANLDALNIYDNSTITFDNLITFNPNSKIVINYNSHNSKESPILRFNKELNTAPTSLLLSNSKKSKYLDDHQIKDWTLVCAQQFTSCNSWQTVFSVNNSNSYYPNSECKTLENGEQCLILHSNDHVSHNGSKCGAGCVAGIVIAILAVIAIVIVVIIIVKRKSNQQSSDVLIESMPLAV